VVVQGWLKRTFHVTVIAPLRAEVLIDKTSRNIACINDAK